MKYNFDKNLGEFLENEPMKNHTSFKVGGPCELFVRPKDEKSLIEILKITIFIYLATQQMLSLRTKAIKE